MVTCAVPGCNSSKKENPQNYTFHRFPQDNDVRQKWIKMTNRENWTPRKNSTICSRHFEQICFSNRNTQRVMLRYGSIPTLFMPIELKPKCKMSSYLYRDLSPVASTSAVNIVVENPLRLKKKISNLKRRLEIKRKKLRNVTAQKKRAEEKVFKLCQVIKNMKSLPSLQNDVGAVILYVEKGGD